MRPIIGTNNQINKLLIRPGRGWGFVPVFHVSRCRAAPCCCAPSGSVPLWPHSTLGSQGRRLGRDQTMASWRRSSKCARGGDVIWSPGGRNHPASDPRLWPGHLYGTVHMALPLLRGSVGLTRRSGINCDYAAALIQLFTSLWITLILTADFKLLSEITKSVQSNKFNINENFALLGARL